MINGSAVFDEYNHSFIIEPPKSIKAFNYSCGSVFDLSDIVEMYKEDTTYNCVLVSGKIVLIYDIVMSGSFIQHKLIYKKDADIGNKTRRGGQSQNRYQRNYEIDYNAYIKNVAEKMNTFIKDPKLLIIGGPSNIKSDLVSNQTFIKYFSDCEKKIVTTDNIDDTTINKIVSETDFSKNSEKVNIQIKRYISLTETDPDRLVFGDEILKNLNDCMLESIILPKDKSDRYEFYEKHKKHECNIIIDYDSIDTQFNTEFGVLFY